MLHDRPAPRPRRLGAGAAVCARDGRGRRTPSPSARARSCSRARWRRARWCCTAPASSVDGVRVRAHGRTLRVHGCRGAAGGAPRARRDRARASRPSARRRGSSRACTRARRSSATARSPPSRCPGAPKIRAVMTSDEIRERYLSFFEERGHRRIPSASLVPSAHDPSALLTVAGMHPLKPYFLGQETPPAPRLTNCQKVFRTVDIDNVGNTARHLTFFEMLGNFSFGDYFKREATAFAWELSREVFGFTRADIWVTVFEGDEELGLGPDEEAIECWLELGRAARADRARARARRTSGRPARAGRAAPARSCTSTAACELRLGRRPARRRERALPGVLEPGVHAVRPAAGPGAGTRLDADAAAGEQHRHGPRPEPHGGDPPGQGVGVRDRPVPAADRARRGALGPRATARTSTPTARCASSPTTRAR